MNRVSDDYIRMFLLLISLAGTSYTHPKNKLVSSKGSYILIRTWYVHVLEYKKLHNMFVLGYPKLR